MRKFGYTLFFVGFAWICVLQANGVLRAGLRSVVLPQYEQLSPDPAVRYTAEEVQRYIRNTAAGVFQVYPKVIFPGVIMLIGGLLIARPRRNASTRGSA